MNEKAALPTVVSGIVDGEADGGTRFWARIEFSHYQREEALAAFAKLLDGIQALLIPGRD